MTLGAHRRTGALRDAYDNDWSDLSSEALIGVVLESPDPCKVVEGIANSARCIVCSKGHAIAVPTADWTCLLAFEDAART